MDSYLMVVVGCELIYQLFLSSTPLMADRLMGVRVGIYVMALVFWWPTQWVLRRGRRTSDPVAGRIRASEPLPDRTLAVPLPENVTVHYRLASFPRRLAAGLIDFFHMTWLSLIAFWVVVNVPDRSPNRPGAAAEILFWVPLLVALAYGVVFEYLGQGQTPGKRNRGLRTLHHSGRPLDAGEILVRQVLRLPWLLLAPLSLLPAAAGLHVLAPFFPFEILSVATSRWNQRLGDLAAGSVVVVDPG